MVSVPRIYPVASPTLSPVPEFALRQIIYVTRKCFSVPDLILETSLSTIGQGMPLALEEGTERSGAISDEKPSRASLPNTAGGGEVSPAAWPEVKRPHIQQGTDKCVDYLRGLKD